MEAPKFQVTIPDPDGEDADFGTCLLEAEADALELSRPTAEGTVLLGCF